jgi:hypothetical protein
MVTPFSPFLLAILETYGIQVIHLHPKSITLLEVFAYACEAWIAIKPSVAYFRHLFPLRPSGLNQSSGCVSFITTTGTEGDFINLKWMKKVKDFQSRWLFIDILEESELFLVTGVPPIKLTTWASEALPEEALKTLHPWICDLWKAGVTGTMVGVEFATKRIAPYRTTTGTSGRTEEETIRETPSLTQVQGPRGEVKPLLPAFLYYDAIPRKEYKVLVTEL